jgi:CPA1 family monovalent cation:H+ antiporter
MGHLQLLVALLLATVLMVPLAERIAVPYPVLLAGVGLLLAFLPGLPPVEVPPDLLLPLLLPPLLYAAAVRTSWRSFIKDLTPITLLAVVLVAVSAFAVAVAARTLLPGLPWSAAVVLGAAVAPPDPVTATSVAGRLRLPHRLVAVIEGEGLFNDVTALVLYQVALAAAITGTFSPPKALGTFALSALGGTALGLAAGWGARRVLERLQLPAAESGLTLLVPYVAFLAAEAAHISGVLAVVAAGLYLGHHGPGALSLAGRAQGRAFWSVVDLLLTGLAFLVVGLQLRTVITEGTFEHGPPVGTAAVVLLVLLAARAACVFPVALAGRMRADGEAAPCGWREGLVVTWSGMRGVVTVATALALPAEVDSGGPFPYRADLLFVAFSVVVVTLLLHGLTLPWLVRRLDVGQPEESEDAAEREVAAQAISAALDRLPEVVADRDVDPEIVETVRGHYRDALAALDHEGREGTDTPPEVERLRRTRELDEEVLQIARDEALRLRADAAFDPRVVDRVIRRLELRVLGDHR